MTLIVVLTIALAGCSLMEGAFHGNRNPQTPLSGQTPHDTGSSLTTSPAEASAPWERWEQLERAEIEPFLGVTTIPGRSELLGVTKTGAIQLLRGSARRAILSLEESPQTFSWSPDRRYLVWATATSVRAADLFQGTSSFAATSRIAGKPTSICVFPAERGTVLGGADGKIYRWQFLTPPDPENLFGKIDRSVERYLGSASVISTVACHPGGRFFFSGSWSGTITAWLNSDADLYEGEADERFKPGGLFAEVATKVGARGGDPTLVEAMEMSVDGEYLYVMKGSGMLEVWGVRGVQLLTSFKALRGGVRSMAVAHDGRSALLLSRDGTVTLWNLKLERPRPGAPSQATLVSNELGNYRAARFALLPAQGAAKIVLESGEVVEVSEHVGVE